MSDLTKIEHPDGQIYYLEKVGRKVRLVTEGGSTTHLSATDVQKHIKRLESKDNLRPSSLDTLAFYKRIILFCEQTGIIRSQAPVATAAKDFREWQERMGFNNTQAADALGMGRNQPQKYKDGQPIPRHVALACAAIEAGLSPIGS